MFITAAGQKVEKSYDILIVGAGPAGLAAAESAAEGGVKTLVLEEHREIGLPHHCSGWLWACPFSESLFELAEFRKVVLQKLTYQSIYGPNGKQLIKVPSRGWIVNRVEFDKMLARRAARAGADIVLNTRVVSLLRDNGKVKGVTVECGDQKIDIESRVVIGADGTRSVISGVAHLAGLAEPRQIFSDAQVEFVRVAKQPPRTSSIYLGSFTGTEFGFGAPTGKDSMMISLGGLANYETAREKYPGLKEKLKKAVPIAIFGGLSTFEGNRPLKKLVQDGLILAGDASGYSLIIRAMITGSYAGQVAAGAVNKGDVSEMSLSEYDRKRARGHLNSADPLSLRELLKAKGFKIEDKPHALEKVPDSEVQKALEEMVEQMKVHPEPPELSKIERLA